MDEQNTFPPQNQQNQQLQGFKDELREIRSKTNSIYESMNRMEEQLKIISDRVLNPDTGIYTRLKELEAFKETYQKKIANMSKFMWGLIGSVILIVIKGFFP
jgi:uncharacterized coiled-coil DUF342 family protein